MKAIHNAGTVVKFFMRVGNYKLKYNFESNSQLVEHTGVGLKVGNYKLKYNFESNSQPQGGKREGAGRWEL